MRGIYTSGDMNFLAGHINLRPGRFCTLNTATGVVNYAYLEANVNCISIGDIALVIGDPVTVIMLPIISKSNWLEILDTGARGASVYLDIQSTQGAATGLGKFTAGSATVPIVVSDDVSVGSPSSTVPNTLPVYQTNEVNNIYSV